MHPSPYRIERRKGIYILPNLFTLAALFGGFYAMVMATHGFFDKAVMGIGFAMVFDTLDGRVARLTRTQSAFGEQMDSLADMVSFGVAPALIAYEWNLHVLNRWGWVAAFIYCACAALRLARFNVNTSVVDKRFFQGLPSPAAAALVVGFIWVMMDHQILPLVGNAIWGMFAVVLYAGLTMVTNVPFYSFKGLSMKRTVPFAVMILLALAIAVVNTDLTMLFAVFALYSVSGYALYAFRRFKGLPTSVIAISTQEPEERGLHE